jgi:hypothetical protein
LLVSDSFLCIGITYVSLFLLDLFISNLISSSCTLVFRLGKNLSSIPRSIPSKQKFPLILPLSEHKTLLSYLFSSDMILFLAQIFASQVEYCTPQQQIYAQRFLFFSSQQSQFQVPAMEPFVGTRADPGFNASTTHQQNPNYRSFRKHL